MYWSCAQSLLRTNEARSLASLSVSLYAYLWLRIVVLRTSLQIGASVPPKIVNDNRYKYSHPTVELYAARSRSCGAVYGVEVNLAAESFTALHESSVFFGTSRRTCTFSRLVAVNFQLSNSG